MGGRMEGQVAIVTGGATGIGRGISELLASEGARVVVASRSAERGQATVASIQARGGAGMFVPTDVTSEAECRDLVARSVSRFGVLHVLVNNAGVFPRATLEETTEEFWDQVMAVNLKGAFFCCKHAVPVMRETGSGAIVNIGSSNAYVGGSNLFAYSISKGGLVTLTRNLARALAPDGIRVNYVNPGWVITEKEIEVQELEGHDADWLAEEAPRRIPIGRHQEPADAAYAVLYLASREARHVTGEVLNVDGGMCMR